MSLRYLLQATLVALLSAPSLGGFTDAINADHVLTSLPAPRLSDNTSLEFSQEQRQGGFIPMATSPFATALGNLATGGGGAMGGLRTVMMGGMLYGLSLIPAVVLALGGQGLPLGGMLGGLGLGKRALPESYSSAKMPLLSEGQTRRLLGMLQAAFRQWNVADELCKQLFVCQMYRQVSSNGVTPDLELFKEALLHILEKGGKRRAGRAAEHLLSQYEHYFVAARMGMNQDDCEVNYSQCDLSLYPANDGFKKQQPAETKDQSSKKKTEAKDQPSKKTTEAKDQPSKKTTEAKDQPSKKTTEAKDQPSKKTTSL